MRLMVTGGGTGGHLFPGIALAEGMQQLLPECRVMFVGTERLLDQETLKNYDFELASVKCAGLKGLGIRQRIRSLMLLLPAVLEARGILQRFRPDLVFGVGGYVTGPVLLAARLGRIPLCIHEQNSVPGLANRVLAKIADRVFLSLPCRYPFPAEKTVLTGNPVRQEIIAAAGRPRQSEKKKRIILILGGSQGAHKVNLVVTEAAAELADDYGGKIEFIHQTGRTDEAEVRERYRQAGVKAEVRAFFRDMAEVYTRADFVVSRAGATTLAEIAVMGLPALLIPYPYAADDHQKINGLYYQEGGGAKVIVESGINGPRLAGEIRWLVDHPAVLQEMADKMRKMGNPEATDTLIQECLALVARKKGEAKA